MVFFRFDFKVLEEILFMATKTKHLDFINPRIFLTFLFHALFLCLVNNKKLYLNY